MSMVRERGWLIDITKCIGCRSCQVACKRWNERPSEKTEFSADWTNPPKLSSKTWTMVAFHLDPDGKGGNKWRFVKRQCMHCLNPPCESVCPAKAIYTRHDGVNLTHYDRCFGCHYCVISCPYGVRHYDLDAKSTVKCTMCFDRIDNGKLPACVQACPALVMEFGTREEIVQKARARAKAIRGYVFGDEDPRPESIGTHVIYVSDVPLEKLGFPTTEQRIPTGQAFRSLLPSRLTEAVFGGTVAAVVCFILWRRARLEKAKMEAVARESEKAGGSE